MSLVLILLLILSFFPSWQIMSINPFAKMGLWQTESQSRSQIWVWHFNISTTVCCKHTTSTNMQAFLTFDINNRDTFPVGSRKPDRKTDFGLLTVIDCVSVVIRSVNCNWLRERWKSSNDSSSWFSFESQTYCDACRDSNFAPLHLTHMLPSRLFRHKYEAVN